MPRNGDASMDVCPGCGQPVSVPIRRVTERISCPACGKHFEPFGGLLPEGQGRKGVIACPTCGGDITFTEQDSGRPARCESCRLAFIVPSAVGLKADEWIARVREAAAREQARTLLGSQDLDSDDWLRQRFLPIFAPASSAGVVLILGWVYWGFWGGLLYLLGFAVIAALAPWTFQWFAQYRDRRASASKQEEAAPRSMPLVPRESVPPPAPMAPVIPRPLGQVRSHQGRLASVWERPDNLGLYIVIAIVLALVLLVVGYREFIGARRDAEDQFRREFKIQER